MPKLHFLTGERRIPRHAPGLRFALLAATIGITVSACSAGGAPPREPTPGSNDQLSALFEPVQEWTVVSDDLDATLATPDLAVGHQRVAVVLSDRRGLVRFPVLQTTTYRYPHGYEDPASRVGPVESAGARYFEFPFGARGIHVASFAFDEAGEWSLETRVPRPDGSISIAEIRFRVSPETVSVPVGASPPPSRNRLLSDSTDISMLTTGSHHDPGLYKITIADALQSGRPSVVVFASPAFCTNAVCGPQVEVASELRQRYGDTVNFIHVDLFENPHELQGDLSRAMPSPILAEWGLVSQEWTYVLDRDGVVSARFENFVPEPELAVAIDGALASG